jgi:hypothetical protein
MLTVTDAAANLVQHMLRQAKTDKCKTARIAVGKHGPQLLLDTERPGDTKVSHDGKTIMVYDQGLADLFAHKQLDAQTNEDGEALVFREA